MIRLNRTHLFLNLQAKFFNYVIWQNFQRIKQNSLNSPTNPTKYAKFALIIDPFTLCFRPLTQQTTLRNCSELCRTCHSPHAATIHLTPHGDNNSNYIVDRSGSNDLTIVHTTPAQARIEYGCRTCRNYELHERQSPPEPRFRISDGLR